MYPAGDCGVGGGGGCIARNIGVGAGPVVEFALRLHRSMGVRADFRCRR